MAAPADPARPAPAAALLCLAAVDPLVPEYRSAMQAACMRSALGLCLAQQAPVPCIDAVIAEYRNLFYALRVELPQSLGVETASPTPRLYRNALRRADRAFAADWPCGTGLSVLEEARCRYSDISRGVVDLFQAARLAGVPVRLPERR